MRDYRPLADFPRSQSAEFDLLVDSCSTKPKPVTKLVDAPGKTRLAYPWWWLRIDVARAREIISLLFKNRQLRLLKREAAFPGKFTAVANGKQPRRS
jgi:hypothetical protein